PPVRATSAARRPRKAAEAAACAGPRAAHRARCKARATGRRPENRRPSAPQAASSAPKVGRAGRAAEQQRKLRLDLRINREELGPQSLEPSHGCRKPWIAELG